MRGCYHRRTIDIGQLLFWLATGTSQNRGLAVLEVLRHQLLQHIDVIVAIV